MKKQKGVTIVGVLIGITILSVALAAQIRLLGSTIRRQADLRNLIIATNLAREGVEIGFSWRVSQGWNALKLTKDTNLCTDIKLKIESGNGCLTKQLNPVTNKDFRDMKAFFYEPPEGLYNTPPFWRTIRIEGCPEDLTNDVCLILKSTVGWETGKQVEITKKIYNWYVP